MRETLIARLAEPAPGRLQLLSGPRQVGKTHLLLELAGQLGELAIYAAADAPAAALGGWLESQWAEAERLAKAKGSAVLLLDEIHYLAGWERKLKTEHDRIVRDRLPIHVVATGSSSLKLGRGARETMAGRFESLRLLHWPAAELVRQLGLEPAEAVDSTLAFGTYPGALAYRTDPDRRDAYLREAIVEPALGRDLLALEWIRKPALLRQVFAVAVGHPAEIVSLQKLRGELADAGALATIAHYLEVLEAAFMVAGVRKYSRQAIRRRASPPKLILLNQGLLAAHSLREASRQPDAPAVASREVENACIALAWNAGQEVFYWREEPYEVDLISTGSWGNWAIEIKTGRTATTDLAGLLRFVGRHRQFRPLLVHSPEREPASIVAGTPIVTRNWRQFLLEGPPA
ncbi:MAG: ATP-binding protein [Thermoanaerobaculia bacterium]